MLGEILPRGWEQSLQSSVELTIICLSVTRIGTRTAKMVFGRRGRHEKAD